MRLAMHELAIAQSIVEMLDERAQTCHARRVKNVRLCIGEANGVVIASLTFCFEMLTSLNPSLTGAQLVIDTRPHRAYCRSCHKEFPVIHFVAQCPCVNNGAATSFPAPNFGSLKWKSKHRSKVEAMPKVMIAQHILAANETI